MSTFPFFFYNYFDTLMNIGYYKITYFYYEERMTYMYTILLTDDEQCVLDALTNGIDWDQLGVATLLTATDGLQALEILKNNHVDLLITDIIMPRMDGLALITNARKLYPNLHFILLTAHAEFEYARNALLLGVENYILKPIMHEELESTIEKALDNIYTSKKNNAQLFQNNILSRWVNNNISSQELSDRALLLGLNIYLNAYCVICMRKRNQSFALSSYIDKCLNHLDKSYATYSFWDDKGRLVLIVGKNSLSIENITKIFSENQSESAQKKNFIISIGCIVNNSEKLSQSYQTACELLETVNYATITSHILTHDTCQTLINDVYVKELNNLFRITEIEIREEGFQQFINKLLQSNDETTLHKLTHSLIQLFNQEFPQKSGLQKQIYSHICLFTEIPDNKEPYTVMLDLLEYSYLLFRYYFDELSPIVQQAINYIHKNYNINPSIKEFCVKNKMNPTYLGYLFKQETGMFFNNYLTQYRIRCALQLLMETDIQINDIAQKTGFSSPSYFIACFKKQLGLSPIKYRTKNTNI